MLNNIIRKIYSKNDYEASAEAELKICKVQEKIERNVELKTFISIEEDLSDIFEILEANGFANGFTEGIRFLLSCL